VIPAATSANTGAFVCVFEIVLVAEIDDVLDPVGVSVPDIVGVSVIVALAVADDVRVDVEDAVPEPVAVFEGLSPNDTVVVAVPVTDATIDLVVEGVIDAVGEDEGVNELVPVTEEVPEGVGVTEVVGVGDRELDNDSVGVWLAEDPRVIEADAEPLMEGEEELDGDAVLEGVCVPVPVMEPVDVGDGVCVLVGVGDGVTDREGVVVCVTDGVFDEVTEADPEVVNVVFDEADIDALDVPELVFADVDDADVVDDAVNDLIALIVADEHAVVEPESVDVVDRVMLFVADEDRDTVDDMDAHADEVDVEDGDSVVWADLEAVLLAVLIGDDEGHAVDVEETVNDEVLTSEVVPTADTENVDILDLVGSEDADGLEEDCDEAEVAAVRDPLEDCEEIAVAVKITVTDSEDVGDNVADTEDVEFDEAVAEDVTETDCVVYIE
jgi:hypothetical protein